jgi:hypothetical protein
MKREDPSAAAAKPSEQQQRRITTTITEAAEEKGKEMMTDAHWISFLDKPEGPVGELMERFKALDHNIFDRFFRKRKCALTQLLWLQVPAGHKAYMAEDDFNMHRCIAARCAHYWEECNEKNGKLLTYDNGEVTYRGKPTDQTRTPEEILRRKTHRGDTRHTTVENDLRRKEAESRHHPSTPDIASPLSDNGDAPQRRGTGRSTEDQSFFKDMYATVMLEPASECVEEKVYTAIDLENIEDMFYGKGRDDDFKNVEQDKKLFQRVKMCFGRVEDKSMDILDSAQMANEKFQAGL